MNVSKNVKELKEMRENLLLMRDRLEKKLEKAVEGRLKVVSTRGCKRYLRITGEKREYLNVGKKDLLKQLQEKNYYSKLLTAAEKEIADLDKALANLEKVYDVDRVFMDMPKEKRHLIEPYVFVKNETPLKELSKFGRKKPVGDTGYITLNGEVVRSKSELIIADRLKNANVLYLYEQATMVDMDFIETWNPDFTCYNSRTGQFIYWEHFGMLDDSHYLKQAQEKVEKYAEADIVLGKNLIITTEGAGHSLNTKYVDRLIKEFLL